MSSNNPPIIRSSAAFKVEVSPGSLNAGGKKNGIKAGQASGQHRDMAFDFENEDARDDTFQGVEGERSPDSFVTDNPDSLVNTPQSVEAQPQRPDDLLHIDEGPNSPKHQARFLSDAAAGPHSIALDPSVFLANDIKLESDPLGLNLASLPFDPSAKDNSVSIPSNTPQSNLPKLSPESALILDQVKILLKQDSSSVVLIDSQNVEDNTVRLDGEPTGENRLGLKSDAPGGENRQSFQSDAPLANQPTFDEAAAAPSQAHFTQDADLKHREALHADTSSDHVELLPSDPDSSPAQTSVLALHAPLTEQVLAAVFEQTLKVQNTQDTPRESVERSVPQARQTVDPSKVQPPPVVSAKRAQLLEIRQALIEEKKRKAEDYSGRVNAIRQSVAHVNQRLDIVEKTPRVVVE